MGKLFFAESRWCFEGIEKASPVRKRVSYDITNEAERAQLQYAGGFQPQLGIQSLMSPFYSEMTRVSFVRLSRHRHFVMLTQQNTYI